MNDNTFIIIPPHIRADKNLSTAEKMVFGLINGLTNKYGYCFASNSYLGDELALSEKTVSAHISKMAKKGYLSLVLQKVKKDSRTGQEGEKYGTIRHIYVYQMPSDGNPYPENGVPPYPENGESIGEKKKERIYRGVLNQGASSSPNPTGSSDLQNFLLLKKERRARKGLGLHSQRPRPVSGHLTKEEGLAISLTDNIPDSVVAKLAEDHALSIAEVEEQKQAYINWIMEWSMHSKAWGRDMFTMVDRFCSQVASKKAKKKDDSAPDPVNDDLYTYYDKLYGKK